jgi:hypothetical protein
MWAKWEEFSVVGSVHSFVFFLFDGPIRLACCKKNKKIKLNVGGISSNEYDN